MRVWGKVDEEFVWGVRGGRVSGGQRGADSRPRADAALGPRHESLSFSQPQLRPLEHGVGPGDRFVLFQLGSPVMLGFTPSHNQEARFLTLLN